MSRLSFSVIVPVYNGQKYLVETLQSLINQDYDAFEVIAVDDGSICGAKIAHQDIRTGSVSFSGFAGSLNSARQTTDSIRTIRLTPGVVMLATIRVSPLFEPVARALAYYGVFRHPLTAGEIFTFLPEDGVSEQELQRALDEMVRVLAPGGSTEF